MASGNRIVASSWNGLRAVSAPGATTRPSFALRSSPRWALKRRAGFTTAARTRLPSLIASRGLATPVEIEDEGGFNLADVERAQDEVDVCIVGGGPAGLSAAIRLKQLEREKGREIRVVVLEKGAEVGESTFRHSDAQADLSVRFAHSLRSCHRDTSTRRTYPRLA
jgi:NADPH-dependent 2,4-dienoyl-CoA reductase/sulfur reductase-like enzyme